MSRSSGAVALAALLGLACGGAVEPGEPEGVRVTRPLTTVRVEPGALRPAASAYDALVRAGSPAALRVELAPGTYQGEVLHLVDDDEEGHLSVSLVAAGEVLWRGGQLSVEGEEVALEGISFVGARQERHLISLSASERIGLDGVLIADNHLSGKLGAPLVRLVATGAGVVVDASALQVLGNSGPGAGLSLETRPGARYGRVALSDGLWAGNAVARDLSAPGTRALELRGELWQSEAQLAWLPLDGASVTVEGSVLCLASAGSALSAAPAGAPAVVTVTGTAVRVGDGVLEAPEAWIVDRALLPLREVDLTALIGAAGRGERASLAAVRALLE
ncbi:MAG: hypothetical protein JXX28_04390 [Deltaproteobacteria bacterium]|nr:hypothetical protein [Deltaproteobacteria bacterium]